MPNTLYYGDNLTIHRNEIKDESVDLIYLDPPFNSKANYNVLFKSPKGHEASAQIEAFGKTALMLAAEGGHDGTVRMLTQAGAGK